MYDVLRPSPDHVNAERRVLSVPDALMASNPDQFHDQGRLPSLYDVFDGTDIMRRTSTVSLTGSEGSSSSSSATMTASSSSSPLIHPSSSRLSPQLVPQQRLAQLNGHFRDCPHLYRPYPTPGSSPEPAQVVSAHPTRRTGRRSTRDAQTTSKDRNPKAQREADARLELGVSFAHLQKALFDGNPEMAELAATKPGKKGWRPLKSNNINDEVAETGVIPLMYNKTDMLDSATQNIKHMRELCAHYQHLLRDMDHPQAELLAKVLANTGCVDFRLPGLFYDSPRL